MIARLFAEFPDAKTCDKLGTAFDCNFQTAAPDVASIQL